MMRVMSKSFGVYTAATPACLQRGDVLLGDDPADDHGGADAGLAQRVDHRGDQLAVRAGEDREADHVHALLQRRGGDLRGGQADSLVDHVHAGVARAHRDLLGAVGVAVEAGLADEDLRAAAELLGERGDLLAQLVAAPAPPRRLASGAVRPASSAAPRRASPDAVGAR